MLRLDGAAAFDKPIKAGFWRGLFFGFGYFLFGFYWISAAFVARGSDYVMIMPFAVLLFCFGLSLFWAAASALYVKLVGGSRRPIRALIFAGLFFLTEYARGHILSGLPWNLPGYVFEAGKPVSQFASVVGVYGLSALILFLSAALAVLMSPNRREVWPAVASVSVLAGLYGYGHNRLENSETAYVEDVTLRIVHARIPQRDKFDSDKYTQNANHYLQLTVSPGFDEVTHVIWPEGAVPGLMLEDASLMAALDDVFNSGTGNPPVFITETVREERIPGKLNPRYYNSAAAITFDPVAPPQQTSFYDKRNLVPFGEHIPGGEFVETLGLQALSTAMVSISPGRTRNVPTIPGLPPVSIQICYEIIFPGFTPKILEPSGQEPQWILNLSNDAWYGNSTGPQQHINQAGYRAIEEGLPVVRSTSGGISGVINAYGRIDAKLGVFDNGVLDARLPRITEENIYNRFVNPIIALIILLILISCWWRLHAQRDV
ncbi:MAG: apolipoprotein N-acyltransferase [Acidimicrobiales bacterium]|nr:MAG: apolipoprotein N-acyltransferase [Acidimicrobiales bacterium]